MRNTAKCVMGDAEQNQRGAERSSLDRDFQKLAAFDQRFEGRVTHKLVEESALSVGEF